jgi:hypothetical protein
MKTVSGFIDAMKPAISRVDCLLMPVVRHDWTALVTQLRLLPRPCDKMASPTLVLSLDAEWLEEEKAYLHRVVNDSGVSRFFSQVEFFSCRIPPGESVYLRHRPKQKGVPILKYGWKSGPNIQFFRSVEFVTQTMPHVCSLLVMETDLIPLEIGWLDRLNTELAVLGDSLLSGARYQGKTDQSKRLKNHINGNAVLNLSHPDFKEFFAAWEDLLIGCMPLAPENPYDVIIEWALSQKRSLKGTTMRSLVEVMERLYLPGKRYLDSIVNLGGPHEALAGYHFSVDETLSRFPDMALLHCRAALPYVGQLRDRKSGMGSCIGNDLADTGDEEASRMSIIAQSVLVNANRGPETLSTLARMYARNIVSDAAGFERQLSKSKALRKVLSLTLNGADIGSRRQLLGSMLQHELIL